MKVFISQPMKGKTDEEILTERNHMIEVVKEKYPNEEIEIIDSFFQGAPVDAKPLWFLGKALELLSTADLAVFAEGFEHYRGCRIEQMCCNEYGINHIEM